MERLIEEKRSGMSAAVLQRSLSVSPLQEEPSAAVMAEQQRLARQERVAASIAR